MRLATHITAPAALAGVAPCRPKPRTAAGRAPTSTHHRYQQLQCRAATAQQAVDGVAAWLAAAGVDAAKQAVAPGPAGLVCSRAVKAGEQLFAIPQSAWITAQTAADSPEIGQYVAGCA